MKKVIALLLVALMGLTLFGCGKSKEEKEIEKAKEALEQFSDALQDAAKDAK